MRRRKFLQNLGKASAVTAGIVAAPAIVRAEKRFRWRMALPVPKTLPIWGTGMVKFAETLEKMSSGRLQIRVYGAGELVPAFETFDAVKSGSIQVHHSAGYYYQGKIPEASFFTALPFGMNAYDVRSWIIDGGGQDLWDELLLPHGVRCIPCGSTGYQMAGWYNRELKTIADLNGLKIRMPGIAGKIVAKAGASPVLIPGGELFTSLSTGVIDALEWVGPYHDYIMGFQKAAKYYYSGAWHEPGATLELMFHEPSWQELPDDLKMMVRACASELDNWMLSTWSSKNAEYLQKIKSEGKVIVRELPAEILKSLKTYSDEVIAELVASTAMAKKIYSSYSSFQKRLEEYIDMAEMPFVRAFKL